MRITTERLELIAGTVEMARADLVDARRFSELLGARVPLGWPPEFNDDGTKEYTLRHLEERPALEGWLVWYFVIRGGGERILAGIGGFKGKPSDDGTVEVGYSVMPEFRRAGYATEAVAGLLSWAFSHLEVTRVIAETLTDLTPSIRVLEKSGFALCGEGSEAGTIRFELFQ